MNHLKAMRKVQLNKPFITLRKVGLTLQCWGSFQGSAVYFHFLVADFCKVGSCNPKFMFCFLAGKSGWGCLNYAVWEWM